MRHRWEKRALHHYQCTHCGMTKENVRAPAEPYGPPSQWVAVFSVDGLPVARGKTPECPGPAAGTAVEQPPAALSWTRADRYHEVADTGHRIAAFGGADGYRFMAFGPDQAPDLTDFRAWPPGAKEHYAIGEQVPQRFPLLGAFSTADEARAACARDAR